MNNQTLRSENQAFAGTKGVSQNNESYGFKPAFLDRNTGRVEQARLENGQPATIHIIDWLPKEWAGSFYPDGRIKILIPGINAGVVCNTIFYNREQVAEL